MTTIAARDGVIAGDGVETDEEMIVARNCQKVFRLKDGRIVGACGTSEDIFLLLESLKNATAVPKLEDCSALCYDVKGKLWIYEGKAWRICGHKFYAIGSGAYFAYPAMKAGADAIKACRIGAEMDPNSGGRIRHMRVKVTVAVKKKRR